MFLPYYVEILIIIILIPILYWQRKLHKYKSLNAFPGPKPLPILGNALEFGNNLTDVFNNLVRLTKEYGSVYKVYMGPYSVNLVITEPKHVLHFLSSSVHINRSNLHDNLKPFLGNSLGASKGDDWRTHRKLLMPAFHNNNLKGFVDLFASSTKTLLEVELPKYAGKSGDISPVMNLHFLNMICGSVMGKSHSVTLEDCHNYMESLSKLLQISLSRVFSFTERNDLLFRLFSSNYRKQTEIVQNLSNFADKLIADRKRQRKNEIENKQTNNGEFETETNPSFLDFMIDLQENGLFTNQDIKDEINVFLFAGHDTVATTSSFALYELAKHPEIQEEIVKEAKQVFGTKSYSEITMQDLDDLRYLECVIKEVLRLYTVAPFFERCLEHDELVDGVKIPKETIITFVPYAMHRNPDIFPEPEVFNPERFLEENADNSVNKYSYIPFSKGPRSCIGFKFGTLQVKITIAKILMSYKILPVQGFEVQLTCDGILRSSNGMEIRLEKRC